MENPADDPKACLACIGAPGAPHICGEKAMTVDLNRWSAEVVMGWKPQPYFDHEESIGTIYIPNEKCKNWTPLTDWNQLKLVIEKMQELEWYFAIGDEYNSVVAPFYYACFINLALNKRTENYGSDLPTAVLQSARMALKGENDG